MGLAPQAGFEPRHTRNLLVVRTALDGWKVVRIQVGPELGGEDTCEAVEVTRERRGFPAPAVLMKAETICGAGERLEAGDGFFIDLDVEDASVGRDGDVIVAAIGTDGGGQHVRVVGEHGTAADPMFRCVHRTILRATGERLLRLEWIAGKTPAEGVRALTVPRGNEAEKRGAQLSDRVEVAVAQALPVHNAEE